MTKRIFQAVFMTAMGVFLLTILTVQVYLYNYFNGQLVDHLVQETQLVAEAVENEGEDYLQHIAPGEYRFTWIAPDGSVIYDSENDASQMDNHSQREEVIQAKKNGIGQRVRYSSTLSETLIYSARLLQDGSIVRLSVSHSTVFDLIQQMFPWFAVLGLVSLLTSYVLAKYTAQKLLRPLETIDLERPLKNDVYKELHPLLKRLDFHQSQLAEKESLLRQKQDEFDTIISKMKEGLVIVDDQGRLVIYNEAARNLLELEESALSRPIAIFQRQSALKDLLTELLDGQKTDTIVELQDHQYKVIGRPIWSEQQQSGAVLLFFDVTEQYYLEKLRREFTATVSHELRTPLHILSGYSEILQSRIASPDDVVVFAEKIHQESQRMIQLVEDILQLAQLDEGRHIRMEDVQLTDLVQQVLAGLEDKAVQKNIALSFTGPQISYHGNPVLLQSIIFNLCDNAIKYNTEHGQVHVSLSQTDEAISLVVEDTGLGISSIDQERMFERFYRADKSRSKQVGGTGLGLSIVKHALQVHGATIHVQSQLGQGTVMKVKFPK